MTPAPPPSTPSASPAMESIVGDVAPPELHVMTLNARRRMPRSMRASDRWARRSPRLRALLDLERPSVVGLQEVLPDQALFVRKALGDRYGSVGQGRAADGSSEACPIHFDRERLELVDEQQLALSERPDEPGSRSWGAAFPRIVTIATLGDVATGQRLVVLNTHLDHVSGRARLRSAELLAARIAAQPLPAILLGDLNAGERSAAVRTLLAGGLADAWHAADERLTPRWGTFPDYGAPRPDGRRIDWIMTTPAVHVDRVAIDAREHRGGWPSDHLPVHAVVRLDAAEASA